MASDRWTFLFYFGIPWWFILYKIYKGNKNNCVIYMIMLINCVLQIKFSLFLYLDYELETITKKDDAIYVIVQMS